MSQDKSSPESSHLQGENNDRGPIPVPRRAISVSSCHCCKIALTISTVTPSLCTVSTLPIGHELCQCTQGTCRKSDLHTFDLLTSRCSVTTVQKKSQNTEHVFLYPLFCKVLQLKTQTAPLTISRNRCTVYDRRLCFQLLRGSGASATPRAAGHAHTPVPGSC